MSPATSNSWSPEEVARRWVKLYPTGKSDSDLLKIDAILASETLVALYRRRLSDLSWLMKSISEPIARRANAEDKVNGRFWQGRFKCQLLRDQRALLAAMTRGFKFGAYQDGAGIESLQTHERACTASCGLEEPSKCESAFAGNGWY